ncbi:DUF4383 domain-containing protein [Streptomyces sp. RKAG337]|uniref:DUF4383 domain-containing protein n=1 Tax=Streptomyces sp. RKAG337 TaxID=2893404 RepID=UPI0020346B72|nr:DUF4383 domain-containing protein [Streptomyces sp. RKAG337]MCM2428705.1 DUF4383 domain-containing protein [Streptomyces sp. RKAG337]
MKLKDEMPVDHRLRTVYRVGAGLCGVVLLVFGVLGLVDQLTFLDTTGRMVAGLSSNGLLSVLSLVFGALLIGASVVGGNIASTIEIAVGSIFILSGFVNLALLDSSFNYLAFRIPNVLFSFAMGLLVATFGMYGRVSGSLPHDNPYWQQRHPQVARTTPDRPVSALPGRGSHRAPRIP